jgi:Flp pilus assembly protein TadG
MLCRSARAVDENVYDALRRIRARAVGRPRVRRDERAQSLVELALIVPLLLILTLGVIDFGMGLRAYISVAAATREGARYAAIGNPAGTFVSGGTGECNGSTSTTTVGKVCSTLDGLGLSNIQTVSVTYPNGDAPGNSVSVQTQYRYHYITPLRRVVNFLSAGALPGYITISSGTDMRLE